MTTGRISRRIFFAMAALATACTVSKTPAPPLSGPSALGLSLEITAEPDTLSFDGVSKSQITILVRDSNGQPQKGQKLRAEIVANGKLVDFGALSARMMTTDSNGNATVSYMAPNPAPNPTGGATPIPTLSIAITPFGTNSAGIISANAVSRFVGITLVPPGVITGGGPTAKFTFAPAAPVAFNDVFFDASTSTSPVGTITSYVWDFGDRSNATDVRPIHRFAGASTYHVVLTVTDNNGLTGSTSTDVLVTAAAGLKADFTFSPAAPSTLQPIYFNGGISTSGVGHSIVRYAWDFGAVTIPLGVTGSGITVTTSYAATGGYNVTLTVTDDAGQISQTTKPITVSSGNPSAVLTLTKTGGNTIQADGSQSTATGTTTIVNYNFIWGDGTNTSAAAASASHTYGVAGTHTVTLVVTDSSGPPGRTGSTQKDITTP